MSREQTVKDGVYRNFKGNIIRVFDSAINTETGEELALYRVIWGKGKNEGTFARPASMWEEQIDRPEYQGPRFTYLCYSISEWLSKTNLLTEEEKMQLALSYGLEEFYKERY